MYPYKEIVGCDQCTCALRVKSETGYSHAIVCTGYKSGPLLWRWVGSTEETPPPPTPPEKKAFAAGLADETALTCRKEILDIGH